MINSIYTFSGFSSIHQLSAINLEALKLPTGANYLRCSNFNLEDVNTSILNFYQIGPNSYRTEVLIDLLVLIAQEPVFYTLRTIEQLAYDVSFNRHNTYGILGYSIKLHSQETKFLAEFVDERIENFRREFISIVEKMSDDDFDAIKASLVKIKLSEDNKLGEEVSRNWNEIESGEYNFDRLHKEVEAVSTISKSQLLEFYRTHYGENERKLSVQIIGNVQATEDNEKESEKNEDLETRRKRFDSLTYVNFKGESKRNLITDFIQFKNSLDVYAVTKMKRDATD